MEHPQTYLLVGVAVVAAFFLAGGAALCNGTPAQRTVLDIENDPDYLAAKAEMEARRREREGVMEADPVEKRVSGAFYPEDHPTEEPSAGLDPLIVAGVGGGLVFGLVGGAAFLMLGGRKDDAPSDEPSADPPA
ncbi:MAG: hypothetical protein R3F61_31520 [Myxococcota bacterium]